jgi:D-glucosaminate-6-phosphate ammonia-lyase
MIGVEVTKVSSPRLYDSQDLYDFLGVPKIINAAGTYTLFGGSRMRETTIAVMAQAARSFVEIPVLMRRANDYLARITNNEAAFITSGAAAGLYLSTLACMINKGRVPIDVCWDLEKVANCEAIIHRAHRNAYDWSIVQTGVKLVEIGWPSVMFEVGFPNEFKTSVNKTIGELKARINENTIAIFYTAGLGMDEGGWVPPGAAEFETVLAIAKEHDIPVVVDAAAQLPPVENLWAFTKAGADIVLFSGGKDLRGPQSAGLMVGRKDLLDTLYEIGNPNHGPGRMFKVGREEIAAMVAAVDYFVHMDHDARLAWCEEQIEQLKRAFHNNAKISIETSFPNEAGQPIPRALVKIHGIDGKKLVQILYNQTPKIAVTPAPDGIFVNPMTMEEGEIEIVVQSLQRILDSDSPCST